MAKFKLVVSDPKAAKTHKLELEGDRAVPLLGKRIGDTLDGSVLGQSGCELEIKGGSDKDGFPMRPDIHGGIKARVVLSKGVGFSSLVDGQRKRKTVRGNLITEDTLQVNLKVVKGEFKAKDEPTPKSKESKK